MKEIELINKRKPREKHFLQADGTIIAKIYDKDIHYKKNGKYEEIDNTLVNIDGCYFNKCNDYKVQFHEVFENTLMKMEKEDYFLEIRLNNSKKTKCKKKQPSSKLVEDILYENILDGIDIEYKTLPNKVKETIVLHEYKNKKLIFDVITNLELYEVNNTIIAKKDKNIIFTIEKPYMEDSNGKINRNISYKLKEKSNKYELELVLDEKWLKSKETVYPVYIDPTISNVNQSDRLYDTYIYPGDTGIDKNGQDILKAGFERKNGVDVENRTLMKFELPEIGTGSEIIYADLTLVAYPYSTSQDFTSSKLVTVHRVTSPWEEGQADWETMNDKFDSRVEAIIECWRSSLSGSILLPTLVGGDITSLVKKWYRDTPNYGIIIQSAVKEYVGDDYPAFFSKNNSVIGDGNPQPIFTIYYRNQNGLEDYLHYKSQFFTNGTNHINTYNGNMTTIFDVCNTIGGQLPANVQLVYNTNDVILNNETHFGKGYRLNFEQTIKPTTIEDIQYLEYVDEDGTIHYFYKDELEENIYHDEDGLNLTIEVNENQCTIKDTNNNRLKFTKNNQTFYLTEICDADNNTIEIEYNSNNQVSKIRDKYNSEITIEYNEIMKTISGPGLNTKLSYTDNKLTSIETIDGITTFEYNELNLISKITDVSGIKIKYEYYENKPYKVKKVLQYGVDDSLGQSYTLKYGYDTTKIVDNKGKTETLIFNAYGNLISRNSLKSSEDIMGAYSLSQEYGENNKIVSESIPVTYVKNYLKNTSFETDAMYFSPTDESTIETEFSTAHYHSGTRALKVTCVTAGQSLEQNISLPKGDYYTFSGYFKVEEPAIISLSYIDSTGQVVRKNQEIEYSNEFAREDVSIYYAEDAASDLKITISFQSINVAYIDDIQIEKGEVANLYNMIENSDFSDGIEDWNVSAGKGGESLDASQFFSVVKFNENQNTALKVSMDPLCYTNFRKDFPIKGKKGDVYTVSFWYKNEGVPECRQYAGNKVTIYFKPVDGEAEYCILSSGSFNPNEEMWQYFTYRSEALEDFDEVSLIFNQNTEANDFYITNISLYKNVTSGDYEYDNNGNLISYTNQSKDKSEYKYDKNNQLISVTTPKGKKFKYEYDKEKPNRVISALSSAGIVNKYKYDNNGNLINYIASKKVTEDVENGNYKIRSKGTHKFLKSELNMVLLESNACSNTIWTIEKNNEMFKFKYTNSPSYSITYSGRNVILSKQDNNNIFNLEKTENGSYYIYVYDENQEKIYLKAEAAEVVLENLDVSDSSFEFYIELIENEFVESNATYTENGKFLKSIVDNNFNSLEYETDSVTGLSRSMIDNDGHLTEYTYNEKNQIKSVAFGDRTVNYSYNANNLLSKISHNSTEYNFSYDKFLNVDRVTIGDNLTLVNNEYEENNGELLSTTYGNNQKIQYEYDSFDRVKRFIREDKSYDYKYDANGNLAKVVSGQDVVKYNYDLNNRIYGYRNDKFKFDYTYDVEDNIVGKNYKINNQMNNIDYTYNENDYITEVTLDSNKISYQYDSLGRIVQKNISNGYNTSYNYINNGKRTTNLIKSIKNGTTEYEYKYDKSNNITHIYCDGNITNKYYYDYFNELVKEENYQTNELIEYTYDASGNILAKVVLNLTTNEVKETKNYQYQNQYWKDQLTSYAGKDILYDLIGNPVSIGNSITLSWINGKSLNTFNDIEKELSVSYKYNEKGIRTSKVINNNETKFYLEDNNIIYEQTGNDVIYYQYDLTGLCGLKYNGNTYYYLKNIHDDIVGILNSNFEQVISYEYDSWGNLLSIKDAQGNNVTDQTNIGIINPFRYRSYYYDKETNLYYLNSRYYNPEWGRFLNADGILGANEDILAYNLYAYVSNNPIMYSDELGYGIISFVKKVVKKVKSLFTKNDKKSTSKSNTKQTTAPKITTVKSSSGGGNVNKLPSIDKPNSVKKAPNGNERYYGPDGKMTKDIDWSHPEHHPELDNPHQHDWVWGEDGKPKRGPAKNVDAEEAAEAIVGTAAIAGALYVTYRIIRMIPSLHPGLWWTIPLNASTP